MIVDILILLIYGIITIILTPINYAISTYLPVLNTALSAVADYLDVIFSYIGWVISLSGIPSGIILLIIAFYTFTLTVPLIVWTIKQLIAWFNAIKW